jgi:hypothetical protein
LTASLREFQKNENELKRYFFKLEDIFGFSDVRVYHHYPDASAFYDGVEINIEFELSSSNFKKHKHDKSRCDLIICWENDDYTLEISTLELSTISKNWLELKTKAMQEFISLNMGGRKEGKTLEDGANRMKLLMDTYNFDKQEAIAHYMGITKEGFRQTYGHISKDPEFLGGKNMCLKKDLDVKYLNLEIDLEGIIPIVVCYDCVNKNECRFGLMESIGYYFIFINDEERPRRSTYRMFPLPNKKCLEHCTEPPFNIWETIRFNRY